MLSVMYVKKITSFCQALENMHTKENWFLFSASRYRRGLCIPPRNTGTRKFDSGLSHIVHHDLHWLDVPRRVIFKLCMTVYKCLHSSAPKYLAELCVPVADVAGRRQLRSASRGLLNFPRYNVSNYGRRAFCFAGPYVWNSLPEHIRQST